MKTLVVLILWRLMAGARRKLEQRCSRALPAFLHFWQTNRPARSCTHVVGTWRNANNVKFVE